MPAVPLRTIAILFEHKAWETIGVSSKSFFRKEGKPAYLISSFQEKAKEAKERDGTKFVYVSPSSSLPPLSSGQRNPASAV